MALPNEMGSGGNSFHGEDALRVREILGTLGGGSDGLVANFNALLAKLDDDSVVNDTNYESTLKANTKAGGDVNFSFGDGGAFTHGEGGRKLRQILVSTVGGAAEVKTQLAALVTKLNADSGTTATFTAPASTTEAQSILYEMGDGAAVAHGDEARRLKRVLDSSATLNDELVADFNNLLDELDADTLGDSDYASTLGIS